MKATKKALAYLFSAITFLSVSSCGKTEEEGTDSSDENVTISFSWWGDDSQHEVVQAAVAAFMKKYPDIMVECQFGAWSGWEESIIKELYAGTATDVNRINPDWIFDYSADGSIFLDMNKVSDTFDLSQYEKSALDLCTVAGELQAIPVSMTGRIFYWNKTTFDKAGISTPVSLEELFIAGEAFRTKLGEEYYPLAMDEYDRAVFLVYYLESVYGKAWIADNKLNYTAEEITNGLEFICSLEEKHVIPSVTDIADKNTESLGETSEWTNGKYAGIFGWDTSASELGSALKEGQELIVGDYFKDFGEYCGGFSEVSLAFAISENTKYPEECAVLLNYLLNDIEGTAVMKSELGIPVSKAAFENCKSQGLLDEITAEANRKILARAVFPFDKRFESPRLKGNPDGVYYDVFGGLSSSEYTPTEAALILVDGINSVLSG